MKIFMPFILLIGLFAYGTASADVMVSAGSNGFAMQISSAPVFSPAPPHVVHHGHHAPPPPVHHHGPHHHGPHHPHAHYHDPRHNHGHRH